MRVSLLSGWNLSKWQVARAPQGVTVHAEQPVRERGLRWLTECHQTLQVIADERTRPR